MTNEALGEIFRLNNHITDMIYILVLMNVIQLGMIVCLISKCMIRIETTGDSAK